MFQIKIFCCDFQLDSYQNLLKVKNTVSDVKENGILHRNGNVRQLSVRRLLTMPTGIVDGHHELNQVHSWKLDLMMSITSLKEIIKTIDRVFPKSPSVLMSLFLAIKVFPVSACKNQILWWYTSPLFNVMTSSYVFYLFSSYPN